MNGGIYNFNDLENADNAQSGVFKRVGSLTIDSASEVSFSGIGKNTAVHIIVEGDLIIKNNIVYKDGAGSSLLSPNEFPSLAFTVFGDIKIDPGVTHLDGIYIAMENDKGEGGKITSVSGNSDKQLTIGGSLVGDMQELLQTRTYTGSYVHGGGNVVIQYSERIHLNTPPGLTDWLDINIFKQSFGPSF